MNFFKLIDYKHETVLNNRSNMTVLTVFPAIEVHDIDLRQLDLCDAQGIIVQ